MITPDFNLEAAAEELKSFIELKKFDMVDYSLINMECYPPNDKKICPELTTFANQWQIFLDNADEALNDIDEEPGQVSFKDVLAKYKPELLEGLELFDAKTEALCNLVNSDKKYWENLRATIVPLYEKSPYYEQWKERWQSISIAYDPTPLEVKTTQMWTNQSTGERVRGEVVRTTEYPEGFIVKIN